MVHRGEILREYRLEVAIEFHRDGQDAQWASSTAHRLWGDEDAYIELDTSGVPESVRQRQRRAMAVSSDGRLLAVAGSSIIQIFAIKTQNLLGELRGHPHSVDRLVFAPCEFVEGEGASKNGYTLLSTSRDDHARSKVILVWSLDRSGCQIGRLRSHLSEPRVLRRLRFLRLRRILSKTTV
jgi:WD40 repeat protein